MAKLSAAMVCLVPLAWAAASAGAAIVSFEIAKNFPVGSEPYSVGVGDFNGDGTQDLVTANLASDDVSVLLGNGTGSLSSATNFAVGGDGPVSVAVGDFNRDGKQDLAVANVFSDNVSVLLAKGGGFGRASKLRVGIAPSSLVAGDFNGDGKPDLATANFWSDDVSVLLGRSNGSFSSARNFPAGFYPASIAAGDFNGDGNQDLVTANDRAFSPAISVLLGRGDGAFDRNGTFDNKSATASSITVGDLNADGKPDLATANNRANNVSVLLGRGDATFDDAMTFTVLPGDAPVSILVGDFDSNGKQDLATANERSNNVSVLPGVGDGIFGPASNFGVGAGPLDGPRPLSVAIGQLNGDSRPDLVTGNSGSNTVAVLLNNTP